MVQDRRWAAGRLDAIAARQAQGRPIDRMLAEVTTRIEASVAEAVRRAALPLTITYPADLPVSQRRDTPRRH